VAEVTQALRHIQIGIVVDSVSEVLNIKGEDIDDSPIFTGHLDTDFILGMAKMGGGVKILLDIDKALGGKEFGDFLNNAA
jgi:purine-binding chemotaxis protein CheW